MAESCNLTQIKYTGNDTTTQFSFPFTYMHFYDVKAALWDETKGEYIDQKNLYVLSDASTVQFFTPPPAPGPSAPDGLNVLIYRDTDLKDPETTFYPGSAIRAQDLNDNFDQVRLSVQESRCSLENALDQTVQLSDAYSEADQEAGAWVEAEDLKLASSDAIAARHDAIVGDTTPDTIPYQQPGKTWQNTEKCYSTYWNRSANAWVAYVNTGPRGTAGQDGTNGVDGAVGPQGPTGPKGDKGDGLVVTGYIDVPGPPTEDGTEQGDVIIDSDGIGWFWETDVEPYAWVSLGSIQGPQGDTGEKGEDGEAATVTVGNTATGAPGTEANVFNSGTTSAAVLNFTIPKGEKGEPGQDGLGTIRSIRGTLPITIDSTVDPNRPSIGLDISLLPSLPTTS